MLSVVDNKSKGPGKQERLDGTDDRRVRMNFVRCRGEKFVTKASPGGQVVGV